MSLGVLLFLQLAVAAYACAAPFALAGHEPSTTMVASHDHCAGGGEQPSKLCEQHCLHTAQSVGTQPHGAPAVPLLPLIGIADRGLQCHIFAARIAPRERLARIVDPPPLVRFGVLRI